MRWLAGLETSSPSSSATSAADPTEAQGIIARRAATLAVWCEQAELGLARGEKLDIGEHATATNTLRRLLLDLGLERRMRADKPAIDCLTEEKLLMTWRDEVRRCACGNRFHPQACSSNSLLSPLPGHSQETAQEKRGQNFSEAPAAPLATALRWFGLPGMNSDAKRALNWRHIFGNKIPSPPWPPLASSKSMEFAETASFPQKSNGFQEQSNEGHPALQRGPDGHRAWIGAGISNSDPTPRGWSSPSQPLTASAKTPRQQPRT